MWNFIQTVPSSLSQRDATYFSIRRVEVSTLVFINGNLMDACRIHVTILCFWNISDKKVWTFCAFVIVLLWKRPQKVAGGKKKPSGKSFCFPGIEVILLNIADAHSSFFYFSLLHSSNSHSPSPPSSSNAYSLLSSEQDNPSTSGCRLAHGPLQGP